MLKLFAGDSPGAREDRLFKAVFMGVFVINAGLLGLVERIVVG